MKLIKLSLVAALAVSGSFAGGEIASVEPVVEAPVVEADDCNSTTMVNGKAVLYSYTHDLNGAGSLYDSESSQLGTAITLDVSHKITDGITANVTAIGFTNLGDDSAGYMEGEETAAFINVANITAEFGDTTLVAGRQLLDTPMLSGFDWLLAPGAFEAYTLVNKSIANVTIVGSYVEQYRANNSGTYFAELGGNNWTVGASYSNTFDASIWYYNVDHEDLLNDFYSYTQVYADAGTSISGFDLAAQYVSTDYDSGLDSTTYSIKIGTKIADFDLEAAYVNTDDREAGYIDDDSLYTTMWNSNAAEDIGDSWKVSVATEFAAISVSLAYADYETIGDELNLILGYSVTDCISLDAIFSSTADNELTDEDNALEFIATYKF